MCCRYFDFGKLAEITQQVTKNLNKIIDINYYPVETARRSNVRNRPIGIGVQVLGLPCSLCLAVMHTAWLASMQAA